MQYAPPLRPWRAEQHPVSNIHPFMLTQTPVGQNMAMSFPSRPMYHNPHLETADVSNIQRYYNSREDLKSYSCVRLPPLPILYVNENQTAETEHVPFTVGEMGTMNAAVNEQGVLMKRPDIILHMHKHGVFDSRVGPQAGRVNVTLCTATVNPATMAFQNLEKCIRTLYSLPELVSTPDMGVRDQFYHHTKDIVKEYNERRTK